MPRARTELLRVGGEPTEPEVLVVLPRVADASEHLEAVLRQLDAALGDERLGRMRELGPLGCAAPQRGRRCRDESLCHLEPEAGVGEEVLDRLEGPDGTAE